MSAEDRRSSPMRSRRRGDRQSPDRQTPSKELYGRADYSTRTHGIIRLQSARCFPCHISFWQLACAYAQASHCLEHESAHCGQLDRPCTRWSRYHVRPTVAARCFAGLGATRSMRESVRGSFTRHRYTRSLWGQRGPPGSRALVSCRGRCLACLALIPHSRRSHSADRPRPRRLQHGRRRHPHQ